MDVKNERGNDLSSEALHLRRQPLAGLPWLEASLCSAELLSWLLREGSYLDHSLVGKREDLLGPLLLHVHDAVGFGDVLLSGEQLAVEEHGRLVDYDAFPLQEAAETQSEGVTTVKGEADVEKLPSLLPTVQ